MRDSSTLSTREWGASLTWVAQLSPRLLPDPVSHTPPPPASRPTRVAYAIEEFGTGAVDWAVSLGQSMTELIIREMPEFGGGREEFETLRMGTESSVFEAMRWLCDEHRGERTIPEEALAGDIVFVHRNIALDRVLRGVRLGHSRMSRGFLKACDELVPERYRPEEMRWISDRLFEFIDNFSGQMAVTYADEMDRWSVSRSAARAELVRRILSDDAPGPLTDLSRDLGYDLARQHVALTLWFSTERSGPATPDLERAARELLDTLGVTGVLAHPVGGTRLWCWGSRSRVPDPRTMTPGPALPPDIQVAVGTPAAGIDGFRLSHQQATAAERTARASVGAPAQITYYGDTAPITILSADMAAARELVCRELGPLAAQTATDATLRETLLCYLEVESSPHAAAQRLFVARNTVAYRVRRAAELLGHDIAERRYELHTALLLARQFGPAVLREP